MRRIYKVRTQDKEQFKKCKTEREKLECASTVIEELDVQGSTVDRIIKHRHMPMVCDMRIDLLFNNCLEDIEEIIEWI